MVATPIILDTDIDTDCDDVGALAVLHALADQNLAQILGVICSIPLPATAQCVQVINTYLGRPDVPVGLIAGVDLQTDPRYEAYRSNAAELGSRYGFRRYSASIAKAHESLLGDDNTHQEAVQLYREILVDQENASVTIVAIGLLTAIQQLLESKGDEISPLSGMELVEKKVAKLVTMGAGSFPRGQDFFNWKMDREASATVINTWPTTLVVNEWGETILTGSTFAKELPPSSPVRQAYEIYLGGEGRNRASWDQVTLLYAVIGSQSYFEERTGYRLSFDAKSGEHEWREDDQSQHIHLEQVTSDANLADVIETLMVQANP